MLYKVFDFADKEVHEVMVPRPEVVALSIDLPPHECLAAVVDSPFTRYPVYRGSLDDVVGLLHVRDLFRALYDRGIDNVMVEELVRPAHVVPETKDLAAMLAEFRRQNQHMALVVDEYGAFQGIVTLEDLLEEIVGEIEDSTTSRTGRSSASTSHIGSAARSRSTFNEVQGRPYCPRGGLPHGYRLSSSASSGRAAEKGDEVVHDGDTPRARRDGPRIGATRGRESSLPEDEAEKSRRARAWLLR
jgi:Mg2+/Co2+ transporter CorC